MFYLGLVADSGAIADAIADDSADAIAHDIADAIVDVIDDACMLVLWMINVDVNMLTINMYSKLM